MYRVTTSKVTDQTETPTYKGCILANFTNVVVPSAGLLLSALSLSDVPEEPALWQRSETLHSQVPRFLTPACTRDTQTQKKGF